MYYYGQCRRRCPNRKTLSVWVIFVLSRYQMLHAKKIDNIFQRNILSVVILFYKRRYKIQNAGISPFKSVSHWNFTAA